MKFLFAINPVSGGTDKSDWQTAIRDYFVNSQHTAHELLLAGEGDDARIRAEMDRLRPDFLVAVGGDGTVKLVAEQVLGTDLPMGILPAGSANGLARELGIPLEPEAALNVVTHGMVKPMDVICIGDADICLHLSDIGLNAQLIKYYQKNNWRGKIGYLRGVARVLLQKRRLRVTITANKKLINRIAFMVVLANARTYGTGAVINPDGKLDDGIFEVVIIRQLSFRELLKMFWRFRPFDPSKVEIIPATSVCIETRRKVYFQVDGEYRGKVNEIRATIRPGQLKMLLPIEA